jgi:hypothetical protein
VEALDNETRKRNEEVKAIENKLKKMAATFLSFKDSSSMLTSYDEVLK